MSALKSRVVFTFFLIFIWLTNQAQPKMAYVTFFVKDSLTDKPIELVSVHCKDLKKTLTSNTDGYTKQFRCVPPTILTFQLHHIGYVTKQIDINIDLDTVVQIKVLPYQKLLHEVVVRARNEQDQVADTRMSTARLTSKQINNVPSMIGERDLIKALLLLPGVKTETEGSSSFNVRGGGSDQNLLLINKIPLYSSNHLFGLLSTFNTDIIRDATLLKGAFPAQYGGRLSSVLDVTTQEGDYEHVQVRASASLLAARATVDVPLIRQKMSLIVAGRRTYLDALFRTRPTSDNPAINLSFYDINAQLAWRVNHRNKVTLFAYTDNDRLHSLQTGATVNNTELNWRNQLASVQWDKSLPNQQSLSNQIYLSTYTMGFDIEEQIGKADKTQQFKTNIRDFSWRSSYDFLRRWGLSQLGLQYTYRTFLPNQFSFISVADKINTGYEAARNTIQEVAFYSDNEFEFNNKWRASVGFRGVFYNGGERNYFSPEPRLAISYRTTANSAIKVSHARMQQAVHQLSNPGLGIPIDLWVPANRRVAPQVANQTAFGYFQNVPKAGLSISGELYYKRMNGIISYLDGKSSSDVATLSPDQDWETVITKGNGQAWGAEFLVEKKQGDLTGWLGYTLAYVRNQFDALNHGKAFYPRQDKRHDVSVAVAYKLSGRWRLNASWVFSSGQPVTLPFQAYRVPDYTLADTQIPTQKNGILYVQGDRNAFRMIPFHRLNVAIQSVKPHRWGQSTFEVGLYNAYNRQNPFYYFLGTDSQTNAVQLKSMSLFPVLPGIAYSIQLNTH